MTLNGYGVLALAVAGIEGLGGCAMLVAAGRRLRRPTAPAGEADPARPLLLLLALLLGGLALVSSALWVLVLQSYVPLWEDVRCVVGVLRIGTGSDGAAGWLPGLAAWTSALRATALLAAGAAVCLHLASSDAPERPVRRAHLGAYALVGLLAIAGAAAESAYVLVPKTERFLASGCCTSAEALATPAVAAAPPAASAAGLYFVIACGVLSALLAVPGSRVRLTRRVLAFSRIAAALTALGLGLGFVSGSVAPAVLELPSHACTWCLVAAAPETAVGLALLSTPALATIWSAATGWLGPAAGPSVAGLHRRLGRASLFGCLGGLVFFATQWWTS